MVWPFSSVEREKMTLPLGLESCARGRRSRGAARRGGELAPQAGLQPERRQRSDANAPAERKLHEPRPFCFFGLDAAAAAEANWSGVATHGTALAEGLVEHDGAGCGDVQRADAAGHGNAQQVVAGAADQIVQPGAFAAQNEDAVAGEVELVVVRRRRARRGR